MGRIIHDIVSLCKNPKLCCLYLLIGLFQVGLGMTAITHYKDSLEPAARNSEVPVSVVKKVSLIEEDIREITSPPDVKM